MTLTKALERCREGFDHDGCPDGWNECNAARVIAAAYLAEHPADSDGWQPIDTAPKDGTHILVGQFGGGPGFGYCGSPAKPQHWQAVAHYFDTGKERGFFLSSGGTDSDSVKVTHWVELPQPPETT